MRGVKAAFYPYLKEMRIKAWIKNLFVFVPIVFAGELTDWSKLIATIVAFFVFCLVSSSIYVLNDVLDAEKDALHPVKRYRPTASGIISKRNGIVFCLILMVCGLVLSFAANYFVFILAISYILLNILYTISLKQIVIIDVFCIAAGFILRLYAGSAASGEPISDWLFLTIVAMSLFMGFGKRRGEILKTGGTETRSVLALYDLSFLNAMIYTSAGLSLIFYSLWAMVRGLGMIYTVPLLIFIVCKYLLILNKRTSHGDPTTVILEDKMLLIALLLYVVITVLLLYSNTLL
jgi:4-hydroxybenzoate polyprenyltransferase